MYSPTKQALKSPETQQSGPLQEGGVLEEPESLPKFNEDPGSKLGTILEQEKSNITFSEQNSSDDE